MIIYIINCIIGMICMERLCKHHIFHKTPLTLRILICTLYGVVVFVVMIIVEIISKISGIYYWDTRSRK